jgi:hypothetical protein
MFAFALFLMLNHALRFGNEDNSLYNSLNIEYIGILAACLYHKSLVAVLLVSYIPFNRYEN